VDPSAVAGVVDECADATSVTLLFLGQLARPSTVTGLAVGVRVGERLRHAHYIRLATVPGDAEATQRGWWPLKQLLTVQGPRLVCFNLQSRCVGVTIDSLIDSLIHPCIGPTPAALPHRPTAPLPRQAPVFMLV
jgi:hypothetical protein